VQLFARHHAPSLRICDAALERREETRFFIGHHRLLEINERQLDLRVSSTSAPSGRSVGASSFSRPPSTRAFQTCIAIA
jgi:hypothetical protein